MPMSRREALQALSALFAVPMLRWPQIPVDPLAGTILEFQAGRASGQWTAAQVVRTALDRSYAWNRSLHFTDMLADDALAAAAASDARARSGRLIGPLDGVPIFAKSIYDMKGLPTTGSSTAWAELFPDPVSHDCIEVTRLRKAGAVILGKTVADDFAYRGVGTSSLSGQVRNPYDPSGERTPGGSSAGSAVAAACAVAFVGMGTDDGGSNRIPAQCSGVVGVKPTFGLIPRSGVLPTWPYLDTHGPMARNVADAALVIDALLGPDSEDALAFDSPPSPPSFRSLDPESLRGARLGIPETHIPRDRMSAESLANFDRAVADLRGAGAEVISFSPRLHPANYRRSFTEMATTRGDTAPNAYAPAPTANALLRYFQRHGGDPAAMVRRGHDAFRAFYDVLPESWEEMSRVMREPYEKSEAGQSFARSRSEAVRQLSEDLREHRIEAMVYPTMPYPAFRLADGWPNIPTTLGYGNWLGIPEVSVPAGHDASGLPSGNLSFVGLPGTDARLLNLAHAYQLESRRFVLATG